MKLLLGAQGKLKHSGSFSVRLNLSDKAAIKTGNYFELAQKKVPLSSPAFDVDY